MGTHRHGRAGCRSAGNDQEQKVLFCLRFGGKSVADNERIEVEKAQLKQAVAGTPGRPAGRSSLLVVTPSHRG